jgi:hypothetical protein
MSASILPHLLIACTELRPTEWEVSRVQSDLFVQRHSEVSAKIAKVTVTLP